jgi:hypothetical protein
MCYIPETSEDIKNLLVRNILETLFISTVDSLWPEPRQRIDVAAREFSLR